MPQDKRKKAEKTESKPVKKPRSGRSSRSRSSRPAPKPEAGRKNRTSYARMNILQGAADVFGNLGYATTRVEDILDAAGISRPTFYRFFRNKDDVFDALDEISHVSLLQLIRSAVFGADDPINKIEKCIDAFLRWQAATGPVAKVLRQEALRSESEIAMRRTSTMDKILDLFETESQRIRSEQIDPLLFKGLLAAVERIADELHEQDQKITEADIERGKRVIMRLVYGALADKGNKLPEIPKITDLPRKNRKSVEKQQKEKAAARKNNDDLSHSLWFLDFEE